MSINKNELRIGNWVTHKEKTSPIEVNIYHLADIVGETDISMPMHKNSYHPTPLTEDWLLKFGFVQSKGKWGNDFHALEKNGHIVMFTVEHWTDTAEDSEWKNHWFVRGLLNGNKLKYLHQLQNLFFVLTGEELNVQL